MGPVPAPALEAVSEAQEDEDEEEEEEEEEAELAEEITVMVEEAVVRVETGREALGDNEEEESGAVEIALENLGGQGNAEIEVDEISPPPSPASTSSSNNSFANCCGLM